MANIFNTVKLTKPKKNIFDLSHDFKFSTDMGKLMPTLCVECVPGDQFTIGQESLIRFQPMVAPPMHRMNQFHHTFFVPHRLVWKNFEDYMTNTQTGGLDPVFPTLEFGPTVHGGGYSPYADFLGIPPYRTAPYNVNETVSAIPFASIQKIWNDYYRDQNLQTEIPTDLVDGSNDANWTELNTLRYRAWEHDYFTAALPWAQKGGTVDVPLGDVILDPDWTTGPAPATYPRLTNQGGAFATGTLNSAADGSGPYLSSTGNATKFAYDPQGTLEVQATTINDLRRAFRLQEWLEKNARGGTRYVELILSHFGVRSSDQRLQRPEYITGTRSPVVISEVLNTTGTDDLPQGNMAGHGVSVSDGRRGTYRVKEHGYIITLMSVMPTTAYMDGLPKHLIKTTDRFQYFWPEFANIGEQPIENRELFTGQAFPAKTATFGYIPRYAEYKYQPSRVAGDMRTSLDYWHMARKFNTPPALNEDFVKSDPTKRIFAVTDPNNDNLICHVYHKIRAVRPMPKYGTPTF